MSLCKDVVTVRVPVFGEVRQTCGGRVRLEHESFTTGPDTRWREQPIILVTRRCELCGAPHYQNRKPANDEERARCLEALRISNLEIARRFREAEEAGTA